jgi:hypothetical protein
MALNPHNPRNYTRPVAPQAKPLPIQNVQFTEEDVKDPKGFTSKLNVLLQQIIVATQSLQGVAGPSVLPSGVDVAGQRISNLAAPKEPTDAISSAHADSQYSPAAVGPQLDVGGSQALKGLTYLFLQKYVNQLLAGAGITLSPADGEGVVTVSAVSGGSGIDQLTGDVTAGPGTGSQVATVVDTHLTAPLPVGQGGTGTATPGLVAGTDISVTGSWPDQTVAFTGSGSSVDFSEIFELMGA